MASIFSYLRRPAVNILILCSDYSLWSWLKEVILGVIFQAIVFKDFNLQEDLSRPLFRFQSYFPEIHLFNLQFTKTIIK